MIACIVLSKHKEKNKPPQKKQQQQQQQQQQKTGQWFQLNLKIHAKNSSTFEQKML